MNFQATDLGATLGPQSNLLWLGFSDAGTPGVLDSLGLLHMYLLNSNTWVPFCDVNKHVSMQIAGFFHLLTVLFYYRKKD